MTEKNIGYIVPHSHWDREWRFPLWKNRMALVAMMDRLLDTLDAQPEYANFVLDGQCVAVEDYLAIRPERESQLRKHVGAGRLSIGPWFTLPDLYPIDGECLVRNLLTGIRTAEKFGHCLHIGYNSFGWGQIAQFPQIYAEFGIDFIIAAKNVTHARAPHCEYFWESPDGTRVLTSRLGQHARANFFFNAYIPIRYGMEYLDEHYRLVWGQGGTVMNDADASAGGCEYERIGGEESWHEEKLRDAIEAAWNAMNDTTVPECRLLMSGSDFTDCQPELTRIIAEANRLFPDRRFVHGSLEEYVEHLRRVLRPEALEVVRGELRDGPPHAVSANALATRIHLKQLNKKAENAILSRAEPLSCLVAMEGADYPRSFLNHAWKHLLLAHPHDSINGVTQDKTADDTTYNLRQALEIAETVENRAIAELISRIDLAAFEQQDVLLLAINPLPHPVREVMQLRIDTPREQKVWNFDILDERGEVLPIQREGRREVTVPVCDPETRPWPFYADRHTIHLDTGEIPAGGYKVLKLVPQETFNRKAEFWAAPRTSVGGDIAISPHVLENEFLKVTVASNGTLDLLDKRSGICHRQLLHFEDTGDVGDYWIYYPPYQNRTFTSLGCPARIWLEENGPLAATLGVEVVMKLPTHALRPENYVRGESRRSEELREMPLRLRLTLKKGSPRLEVQLTVENTVDDHRVRMMLPCGVKARSADAAGLFTVDRRPVTPSETVAEPFWPEMQTLPMQRFLDIGDGQEGLAVLNNCFTEYEAVGGEQTQLAITLFRAVRNIICTEFRSASVFPDQHGGQLRRTLEYRFALLPHSGDWHEADLFREAQTFNTTPNVVQFSPHRKGTLPCRASLYALETESLVLSAFKKAEDRESYILRFFNPTSASAKGILRLARPLAAAWRTSANEVRRIPLPLIADNAVEFTAEAHKIVTVEIEIATGQD